MARVELGVALDGGGTIDIVLPPGLSGRPSSGKQFEFGSKRLKIALACEECRNRKVRCDGVEPGELFLRPRFRATLFPIF
jgi:hypothetical protein